MTLSFVDSHTGGEPTRVLLERPPEFAEQTLDEACAALREDFSPARQWIGEPRTSTATVGAIIFPPTNDDAAGGVLFFNDLAPLGMCVHGMIGVAETLRHRGEWTAGTRTWETVAGPVRVTIESDGRVAIENVPSVRVAHGVPIITSGGPLLGDFAYGGNWFCHFTAPMPIEPSAIPQLERLTKEVRVCLDEERFAPSAAANVAREGDFEIDHVGLFEARNRATDGCDVRNFVLCPGGAFDRSPCGTGVSAWLACEHAAGRLEFGEIRIIESVYGSRFEGSIAPGEGDAVIPTIRGRAHVVAEGTLIVDPEDPFAEGILRVSP